MEWGSPIFVLGIIALSYGAWTINTWIRARHGYPVENEWGGMTASGELDGDRKVELLSGENAALKGQVTRLEERIAVLERIATDPARRLSDEIDNLRSERTSQGTR
jgi:hypothetical protein